VSYFCVIFQSNKIVYNVRNALRQIYIIKWR